MTVLKRAPGKLFRQILASSPSLVYTRSFTITASFQAKNRVYDNIRTQVELDDQLLRSASSRTALITLWTASWCKSCKIITPLIRDLIEIDGAGENVGGVSFAEVELDSPTIGVGTGGRYAISSIPTLMAFSRQEAQLETRLTDVNEMKDREFLKLWIEDEARRGGRGGKGGGGGGVIGNMFGMTR